jgi:hypothetical protein
MGGAGGGHAWDVPLLFARARKGCVASALAMASTRNPPPQEFVNDICFRRSTEGVVTVVDSDIRTSASGGSWEDVQTLYIVMPAIGVSA